MTNCANSLIFGQAVRLTKREMDADRQMSCQEPPLFIGRAGGCTVDARLAISARGKGHTTFPPKCGNYRANSDAGFPVEVKNHISWSCHVTLVRGNKQLSNWPLDVRRPFQLTYWRSHADFILTMHVI